MPVPITPALFRSLENATRNTSSPLPFASKRWVLSADTFEARASNFLDHEQRDTLDVGFNAELRSRSYGSINVTYGSGFHDGYKTAQYPGNYLPQHYSVQLAAGKDLGKHYQLSVTAMNVTNDRSLRDNSLTFGGSHYNYPREIYGQLLYRFHF